MYFYRPLKKLQALTFDLDDTLYDNRPIIDHAECESIKFLQLYHPILSKLGKDHYNSFKFKLLRYKPEIYHNVNYWRWLSIKLAIRNAGLSESEANICANSAMEIVLYWRSRIHIPLETHNVLQALSNRWPLVVITNGNVSLEICGLADYFCHVLRAGENGRAKPYQDMYKLASDLLNVSPQNILHIGNDLETDILGAINYGIQACWINNKLKNSNISKINNLNVLPHLEISCLTSLMYLL